VLWDAALHPQFKNGGNVQVKDTTVLTAAALGRASQLRVLSGATELVIACQSPHLLAAISDRVAWTGGAPEDDWRSLGVDAAYLVSQGPGRHCRRLLPAMLRRASEYDRAVAFFRSTVFLIAWPASETLSSAEVAPRSLLQVLADEDIEALSAGYSARVDEVLAGAF